LIVSRTEVAVKNKVLSCFGISSFFVTGLLIAGALGWSGHPDQESPAIKPVWSPAWPVLRVYDSDHIEKISLPVGGIGTGTVGLGGQGNLRDWEIMNRPAKGFVPFSGQQLGPFFAIFIKPAGGEPMTRVLEGPLPENLYEGSHGSTIINHGLPRFREATFAAAHPFGQVFLSDPALPLDVRFEAFNPLVPADLDASGRPVAVLRFVIINKTSAPIKGSICATLPNFIGEDGSGLAGDWKGDPVVRGPKKNKNELRQDSVLRGILMRSEGVDPASEAWGTIALAASADTHGSYRTNWLQAGWGTPLLDFWDDFSRDGKLEARPDSAEDMPYASLTVEVDVPPSGTVPATFFLGWHFPNRRTWTPKENDTEAVIGNYYTTLWADAWQALEAFAPRLEELEKKTIEFVRAFVASDLPAEVKEAALFNLSTLRTQTCFQTPDGRFCGFEGSSNHSGCCWGSCTHVWNYEQATAFLFGSLARSMRETEFLFATDEAGLMSFRVGLPLASRACQFAKAAADGQMGCIMKAYRDWKLSGDDAWLKRIWPNVKKALAFAWIPGGWDANKDGVMEGCQHNTMDVEYYGPNPQMEFWFLGALRAAEEMGKRMGDNAFARICRDLFEKGRKWTDENLFNGEYYIQKIMPPKSEADVAPSLRIGMGAKDISKPDYQLGEGCLVDQLVGQYMAHVCGLGYLGEPADIRAALNSVLKYNLKEGFYDHFNCLRSFVLGDESALLMASYPKGRPENPFPYFTEVMTGFEYAAAVGMIYEGMAAGPEGAAYMENGVRLIRNIRERYDGKKRNPFDEAECGHHYARAMASWAAVLALTGFRWDGVNGAMEFAAREGTFFWSNGDAWGTCKIMADSDRTAIAMGNTGAKKRDITAKLIYKAELMVLHGKLALKRFRLSGAGEARFPKVKTLSAGDSLPMVLK
jgi:uncharacterized protein (DUF608 family)